MLCLGRRLPANLAHCLDHADRHQAKPSRIFVPDMAQGRTQDGQGTIEETLAATAQYSCGTDGILCPVIAVGREIDHDGRFVEAQNILF